MQFHQHGYVSGDPRIKPAAGTGVDRPAQLPELMDVLIVGSGPAGMITAAQLSAFPNINTRIVERRGGRLEIGQADGIQARSVETFQAFGFAERIIAEAYRITATVFWKPDPADHSKIVRAARAPDDTTGISEFPHLIVNQARVLDYFAEVMAYSPSRMKPDYGWEFRSLSIDESGDYPVAVTLVGTQGELAGVERVVHAKYVVGADGAHSAVRESIGARHTSVHANHAWGVMDVLAVTDFPDIRSKCAIQSEDGGNILLIPREGGSLFRMYVDLGEVVAGGDRSVRGTTIDEIIAKANKILHPYTLDVKSVAWNSVYEVGHRLTDRFDDVPLDQLDDRLPRVFITGDACHTHSAKAGQGMNVSMQDGFNLAWKIAHVVEGRSPASLLATYSAERKVIAKNLIDFDLQWSSLMAKRPEDGGDSTELEDFYVRTFEFPAGFMTQYQPSMIVAEATHQELATGFPVGKRFKSAPVVRVADVNPVQLGHHHRADGRWRLYAFADSPAVGEPSALLEWARWLSTSDDSPLLKYTPEDDDIDAVFDVLLIAQQDFEGVDLRRVPVTFMPRTGPFGLIDYELVYAADPDRDIFQARGISRDGAVVVVRPDQYVANVLPLQATTELADFFARTMQPRR
ncbi:phenol 2-monooxygenase [Arthrobacter alpinus]|uniref:FAD-binding monooxygenase n=1 Tax=Arthrobacter alpinus TaxID=656366 RepID=UPI0005CAB24C|nr:FAD-binding monooxygenase [Arthrobacter alpinus]ALV47150.1 phenol 2-monooxygenase [Arthrobacter alpinus]